MNREIISVLFTLKKVVQLLISLTVLSVPLSAHAIVSMENVHLEKPPEGFTGAFDLDFSNQSGNTEQKDAATGVKLQWSQDKVIDFILMSYEYGETDGLTNKKNGFAHLRHIHQLDDFLAWEGFTQVSSNQFTNLTLRALLGGGVRLTLGEVNDKGIFLLGLGAFYEHEQLDSIYPDEADAESLIRANSYLVIKYQFNDYVSLVNSSYYQPSLSDYSDFRLIEDFSLVSKLTETLSLKVGIDIAHDSEPPRDIKNTDSSLKVGISVSF